VGSKNDQEDLSQTYTQYLKKERKRRRQLLLILVYITSTVVSIEQVLIGRFKLEPPTRQKAKSFNSHRNKLCLVTSYHALLLNLHIDLSQEV
jgi:hypothetical protein